MQQIWLLNTRFFPLNVCIDSDGTGMSQRKKKSQSIQLQLCQTITCDFLWKMCLDII
jgi:tartrate dehydratase beta subunit/fumarate hydratase class I family protein